VSVLEEHWWFDTQDRARDGDRLVAGGSEDHLTAFAQIDGDVGIERQPPVGEASRVRDRIPHIADRIVEAAFEVDDAAFGRSFDGPVVSG
jgi:hypothetical protein